MPREEGDEGRPVQPCRFSASALPALTEGWAETLRKLVTLWDMVPWSWRSTEMDLRQEVPHSRSNYKPVRHPQNHIRNTSFTKIPSARDLQKR